MPPVIWVDVLPKVKGKGNKIMMGNTEWEGRTVRKNKLRNPIPLIAGNRLSF